MSYQTLRIDTDNHVMTVTLDRPKRLNAYNEVMQGELLAVLDRIDADDDVRAVIVTGAGRAFCAGMDLEAGAGTFDTSSREAMDEHRDGGGRVTLRIFDCTKPIIAAINGAAVGVGITMTLAMDVRLASDNAKIGFVFTRRGINAEACSSWFLPRIVGISQAMEWVATGRVFPADEALRGRLVSRVLPADDLLPAARALAAEIADHASPVAVALSRQLMWKMLGAAHPRQAHLLDSKAIYYMGQSPDAAEGVQSFLDKRAAAFPMRVSTDMPPFYPWWDE